MRGALDVIIVFGGILAGLILLTLGWAFGFGPRFGVWLVRLKHFGLGVMNGSVRVDYRELAIVLGGAIGIGLIMLGHVLWGSLVALTVQPLWIIDTWRDRAWGKFAMAVYWTAAYLFGAAQALGGV